MSTHTDDSAPDLREGFAALLADEPPFRQDGAWALADAVRSGRRRRVVHRARGAVAVGAAAAAVTGIALVASPWDRAVEEPGLPGVAAPSSAAPSSAAPSQAAAVAPAPDARLSLSMLVKRLGAEHGEVLEVRTSVAQDVYDVPEARARVALGDEPGFDVSASFSGTGQLGTGSSWLRSCSAGDVDGKPCQVEYQSTQELAWSEVHPEQPGRERLALFSSGPVGGVLVVVDNYVETGGEKAVGPSWREVGITVEELRSAVLEAGLLG